MSLEHRWQAVRRSASAACSDKYNSIRLPPRTKAASRGLRFHRQDPPPGYSGSRVPEAGLVSLCSYRRRSLSVFRSSFVCSARPGRRSKKVEWLRISTGGAHQADERVERARTGQTRVCTGPVRLPSGVPSGVPSGCRSNFPRRLILLARLL